MQVPFFPLFSAYLSVLGWAPIKSMIVLNRSQEEELVLADMHVKPGLAWEYCPREALRRVSNVLKEEFNLVLFLQS